MSRFNNVKALATLPQASAAAPPQATLPFLPQDRLPVVTPPEPPRRFSLPSLPKATKFQSICFFLVCAFLISSYANDLTLHLFGVKAYISTFCILAMPVAWVITGTPLRALRSYVGVCWLAFGIWLIIAAPFSVWRGGTFELLRNYFPRVFVLFFYIVSSTITVRQCKQLMNALVFGAFFTLGLCFLFGASQGGRLFIPASPFFSNSNEFALQLCLGMAFMLVLLSGGWVQKTLSLMGFAVSFFYLLKTDSRGVFLALIIAAGILVLLSRARVRTVLVLIPLLSISLALVPAETRGRLFFFGSEPSSLEPQNEIEATALGSQMQRERLLEKSIVFTFENPLFGVGPGQFMVAESDLAKQEGTRAEWRGTHNTYTQVSSEAGIPAFLFYAGTIVLSLLLNFQRLRKTARLPQHQEIASMSRAMFVACCVYAVSAVFFHLAYTFYLPLLLALTVALELAARPVLETSRQ